MTLKEKPVASPCVSVCALDDQDICTGCYRSLQEIGDWSEMNNERKREVIILANQRCRSRYGDLG
ncbi:MAG: putative Fe-S protein YdhL (DUF1289 family) [Zhongshania marina]|jgi:predicted Fe-S protein YdhL (DUF1289 family)|uniref:DUF1289 domain-containing protein n=1 Tax=Zhongshania marina TaxID=2304603 RepID=A0A2S4HGU1_9GAMM|nr:DUF1289 domain-containing protein [Marortus luteolus]POP53197.1 DUF1289 domain-containing protein [Marortus luteolus]RNL58937.1 DUF1289 domain-containing protein [Zhongshania marina]|tara:strand:+ start:675 stop:869 length:195 start_codon:yes stop_codon:yes gene_type:complete